MSRVMRAAALACAMLAAAAAPAAAHQGSPDYRSVVRAIVPAAPGLQVQVLNYDDRLELVNRTGKTVVIEGYNSEPYARVLADGTVQVNRRSPATYLNEDRYAGAPVPKSADPKAAPQWRTLDRTGRFEWHDHRMHWMAKGRPPAVEGAKGRTKVMDYRIGLRVGDRPTRIEGTLFWVGGSSSGSSGFLIASLALLVVLAVGFVVIVRRRRRGDGGTDRGDEDGEDGEDGGVETTPEAKPEREVW